MLALNCRNNKIMMKYFDEHNCYLCNVKESLFLLLFIVYNKVYKFSLYKMSQNLFHLKIIFLTLAYKKSKILL